MFLASSKLRYMDCRHTHYVIAARTFDSIYYCIIRSTPEENCDIEQNHTCIIRRSLKFNGANTLHVKKILSYTTVINYLYS